MVQKRQPKSSDLNRLPLGIIIAVWCIRGILVLGPKDHELVRRSHNFVLFKILTSEEPPVTNILPSDNNVSVWPNLVHRQYFQQLTKHWSLDNIFHSDFIWLAQSIHQWSIFYRLGSKTGIDDVLVIVIFETNLQVFVLILYISTVFQ